VGVGVDQGWITRANKVAKLSFLSAAAPKPVVVGDGINDALALRAGAVGVAMGTGGTDAALASADLVLIGGDLRRLATGIRLSRRSRRIIAINVGIGLGWTAVVVALAATISLGPIWAVLLHHLGTLAVVTNAGRILAFDEPVDQLS
jgi:Cd2+/Zn2+-exporting ATPase